MRTLCCLSLGRSLAALVQRVSVCYERLMRTCICLCLVSALPSLAQCASARQERRMRTCVSSVALPALAQRVIVCVRSGLVSRQSPYQRWYSVVGCVERLMRTCVLSLSGQSP